MFGNMNTMLKRRTLNLALLFALTLLPVSTASACPNCRDSIPDNDAEQASNLPGGFNHSIYFMLGSLFVVGGFVVRMIVKETRSS
jgi:hypothetical protein